MKAFYVRRDEDVHGNTGIGIVAEGVIFTDGRGAMRWLNEVATTVTFEDIKQIERIHGHSGKTVVVIGEVIK